MRHCAQTLALMFACMLCSPQFAACTFSRCASDADCSASGVCIDGFCSNATANGESKPTSFSFGERTSITVPDNSTTGVSRSGFADPRPQPLALRTLFVSIEGMHIRPDDLTFKVIAPDGTAIDLPSPTPRVIDLSKALRYDGNYSIVASIEAPLREDDAWVGKWTVLALDHVADVEGSIEYWGLSLEVE